MKTPRQPRAVPIEQPPAGRRLRGFEIEMLPEDAYESEVPAPAPAMRSRRLSLLTLFFIAAGGLLSLGAGIAIDRLIRETFARNDWLGVTAMFLAALLAFAVAAIVLREIWALLRLRSIRKLRELALSADQSDDAGKAYRFITQLRRLYADRPDTAQGRAALAAHEGEIIDGSDLIKLAERDLLAPIDRRASALVMQSARRVSVVTAISPRALLDIVYVLIENLRLIRGISEIYGGSPGTIGLWRLARNVVTHLAATGAIALGESVVQQIIGHGLAARLSARLGEGVVNGLLTARIGLAAMELCRPAPFIHQPRPKLGSFLQELARLNGFSPESAGKKQSGSGAGAVDPSPPPGQE